ncbi:tyrosine-type recombinase/integrase [Macrococcus brunensis]|uniref:tyrosine-type recombinase/integrase n=1 Tax=Macrococcus brunensis TaxID=198483 RepID=UPI001EF05EB1|nr:tyrosine-type recombinase/integrase [Macrococcus brunensis]ULG73178.1 tyrosine-type recombinase/integrase [Macrococcus brunensis]
MAQFEKRGDKWRFRITYKDDQGKRRIYSKSGFRTKPEASAAAKKAEADIKQTVKRDNNILFMAYIDQYIEIYRKGKVASNTLDADMYAKSHLDKFYTDKFLKDVTPTLHQEMINDLITNEFSLSTIKKVNGLVHRACEKARRDGLIIFNPAEFIEYDIRKIKKKEKLQYMPTDKIKPFLDLVRKRDVMQYFLLKLILETGMRIGEACALTFEDIDRANQLIHVTKSYDQKKDELGPTKTGNERSIYITKNQSNELFKLLQIHNANKIVNADVYHNKYKFIFVNEFGTPIPRSTIYNTMMHCSEKVLGKGNRLSAHKLRHTHATIMHESGVSMRDIQERLGHKDEATTRNIYTHFTDKTKREAFDKLEEYLKNIY